MSNTAFALSPISARATSPTEADFEAIREAFVETARGRWFLEEYTKRNRNADTALVLDAVARIERTLEAQRELKAEEPQTPAAPDLAETLAAIKAIIAAARDSAETALSGPPMDEALAPTRKCARVIREIAWGLRESGADGRICSLLDSQVDAINAACDRIPTSGFRDHVLEAFDRAASQIEQLGVSGEQTAGIGQLDMATAAGEAPNTSSETIEETRNVSNDNEAAAFNAIVETSMPEVPSSQDEPSDMAADAHSAPVQESASIEVMESATEAPSQPSMAAQVDLKESTSPATRATETIDVAFSNIADSEHTSSEVITSEGVTSEDLASETSDGIALDESLFDLSAETTAQISSEVEVNVAEPGSACTDAVELSATSDVSADATIEPSTAEEDSRETPSAPEPEIAASALEPNEPQAVAPVITSNEISVVPQVVESLEAMADVAIEESPSDEAVADQPTTFETIVAIAQEQLPSERAPQIAEQPVELAMTSDDNSEVAVSETEANEPQVAASTPSEDAPSLMPDEVSGETAKTPLPDNMLGEAIAQISQSTANMDMPATGETTAASAPAHMMSFAASSTPDAIAPTVSLGASLIASGIVAKPEPMRNDPLAAFRRMSHAERIAFFS